MTEKRWHNFYAQFVFPFFTHFISHTRHILFYHSHIYKKKFRSGRVWVRFGLGLGQVRDLYGLSFSQVQVTFGLSFGTVWVEFWSGSGRVRVGFKSGSGTLNVGFSSGFLGSQLPEHITNDGFG